MPGRTLPHLFHNERGEPYRFTPVTNRVGSTLTPRQNRLLHARGLAKNIREAIAQEDEQLSRFKIPKEDADGGICIDVEGFADRELKYESLEDRRMHVELLNVRVEDGVYKATVYLPNDKKDFLNKKIDDYKDPSKDSPPREGAEKGEPRNRQLIDSIAHISRSNLESFWMDARELPRSTTRTFSWEVWLRKGAFDYLQENPGRFGITLSLHKLNFPEREICLMKASFRSLVLLQLVTKAIAGFRHQDTFPSFFESQPASDRAEWADDLARRIRAASEDSPAVCLLDTGVLHVHSLLRDSLSESDIDSYNPDWGKEPMHSHGTEMAGVALFGDLLPHLESTEEITLRHRLESVKILPDDGENPEDLYGYITKESAYRAQINAPHRKRVYCMAITADKAIEGKPTAWSSMIDQITSASDDEAENAEKQLFFISVGNIREDYILDNYLDLNDLEEVESPAQAWNAVSVGAITERSFVDEEDCPWRIIVSACRLNSSSYLRRVVLACRTDELEDFFFMVVSLIF